MEQEIIESSLDEAESSSRTLGFESSWDEVGSSGWPLGLAPVNSRISDVAAATVSHSTPLSSCTPTSISSSCSSSSDFDSESTISFFPEKSTSLGTLIGIESSSQFMFGQNDCLRKRNTGKRGRNRSLRSFLGCGGCSREDSLEVSPSLSHFLNRERREPLHTSTNSRQEYQEERSDTEEIAVHNNVLYHNEGWRRSNSCSPSSQHFLHQPNPIASRLHNFWVGSCVRMSSNIATSEI